jgi:hypothetical protein
MTVTAAPVVMDQAPLTDAASQVTVVGVRDEMADAPPG